MAGFLSATLERRRARAASARATGPLAAFYRVPPPTDDTPATDLPLLALDIETTGLDPARDRMLSVGYVPVDGETITLSGARHRIVAAGVDVGQSAIFHGITDDQVAVGAPVAEATAGVLEALAGRVLLAHFATIEIDFLSRVCVALWGAPLVVPVVDTLVLHDRLINRGFDDEAKAGELRLWTARRRYGLPRYPPHGALTDAIACAELYLAHVAEVSATRRPTLKTLRRD